jgi:hypothetical protein
MVKRNIKYEEKNFAHRRFRLSLEEPGFEVDAYNDPELALSAFS